MEEKYPRVGLGVLIENEKGEILMGKRKGAHGAGEWCFSGGKLDIGETIFACARREVLEETGLLVTDCALISVHDEFDYIESSGYHWVNIGVRAMYTGGEVKLMEPEKFEEWRWFSLESLPEPLYATTRPILKNYKDGVVYRERSSK